LILPLILFLIVGLLLILNPPLRGSHAAVTCSVIIRGE